MNLKDYGLWLVYNETSLQLKSNNLDISLAQNLTNNIKIYYHGHVAFWASYYQNDGKLIFFGLWDDIGYNLTASGVTPHNIIKLFLQDESSNLWGTFVYQYARQPLKNTLNRLLHESH